MELWEFEDLVLDWCTKNNCFLQYVKYTGKSVEIHMGRNIHGRYGITKTEYECYHCYLNEDMTFKNVPHGLKSKVRGKKIKSE